MLQCRWPDRTGWSDVNDHYGSVEDARADLAERAARLRDIEFRLIESTTTYRVIPSKEEL
jgi:hypothetical protein